MKTLDQIFEERGLVKGTDFYEAANEYGEQYRRLAKKVEQGSDVFKTTFLRQESILRKIVIGLPNFALNAFVVGLTPDEIKLLDEFYNERYMIPLPKDGSHENL